MNSPSDFLTMWQHNRVFPDPKDGLQGDRGFLEIQAKELNKIFISDATEGYGFLNHTKELMKDINPKKLYPISDGFLYKDKSLWAPIPEENIYCDPRINIWWVWNRIWALNQGSKAITTGEDQLHHGDVKYLIRNYTTEREYKFISLNNNWKSGREILVEQSSDKFIKDNWVSGYFSDRPGLRNFDKDDIDDMAPPAVFYSILFEQHCNKGYIQPFYESPAQNDSVTDYMLMITEKTCIPFLLGTIAIPMNMFYVSEYEKLGFKFVKEINGIKINRTIEWDVTEDSRDDKNPNSPHNWSRRQVHKLDKINEQNSLEDIKKVFLENQDIILHNQKLIMEYMTTDKYMKKLRDWMLS